MPETGRFPPVETPHIWLGIAGSRVINHAYIWQAETADALQLSWAHQGGIFIGQNHRAARRPRNMAMLVVRAAATAFFSVVGGTMLHFWRTGDVIKTDTFSMQWRYFSD